MAAMRSCALPCRREEINWGLKTVFNEVYPGFQAGGRRNALKAAEGVRPTDVMLNYSINIVWAVNLVIRRMP